MHYKSVHRKISEIGACSLYKQKYCYSYSAKNICVSYLNLDMEGNTLLKE